MNGLTCDCCDNPATHMVDGQSPHCLKCMLDAVSNHAGPVMVQNIEYVRVKTDERKPAA